MDYCAIGGRALSGRFRVPARVFVIGTFRRSETRDGVQSLGKSNIIRRILALYCDLSRRRNNQEFFIWRLPDDISCKPALTPR
jgi:hypothetical protein